MFKKLSSVTDKELKEINFPIELIDENNTCMDTNIKLFKKKSKYESGEIIMQIAVSNYSKRYKSGIFSLPDEYKHIIHLIHPDKIYGIVDLYHPNLDLGDGSTRLGKELLGMEHNKPHGKGLFIALNGDSCHLFEITEITQQ